MLFWAILVLSRRYLKSVIVDCFFNATDVEKKKQACIVKFNYNNRCIFLCETSHMGYCKFVVMLGERGFGEETIEFLFKFLVLRGCGVVYIHFCSHSERFERFIAVGVVFSGLLKLSFMA